MADEQTAIHQFDLTALAEDASDDGWQPFIHGVGDGCDVDPVTDFELPVRRRLVRAVFPGLLSFGDFCGEVWMQLVEGRLERAAHE